MGDPITMTIDLLEEVLARKIGILSMILTILDRPISMGAIGNEQPFSPEGCYD
tara:strand:- start:120 stop:278 length:159 start_codon:yes stop_codon:yes gene_type:complete